MALAWHGRLMVLAMGLLMPPLIIVARFFKVMLVLLVLVQVIGARLRGTHGGPVDPFTRKRRPRNLWPGDHFSMTSRRVIFEYVHKAAGYLLLALTVLALCTGLVTADAPRWMLLALGLWWLVMAGIFVWLQRAGRCIDTYQAIWGPDPELPGNRRRPIGFGVVRRPMTSVTPRARAPEK
jgi:hypothetical protein